MKIGLKSLFTGIVATATAFSPLNNKVAAQQAPAPNPTEIGAPKAKEASLKSTTAEFTANADSATGNETENKVPVQKGDGVDAHDDSRHGALAMGVFGGKKEEISAWKYANILCQLAQDSGLTDVKARYLNPDENPAAWDYTGVCVYLYREKYENETGKQYFNPTELLEEFSNIKRWAAVKRREHGKVAYTAPEQP